jgi:hypothetical protein
LPICFIDNASGAGKSYWAAKHREQHEPGRNLETTLSYRRSCRHSGRLLFRRNIGAEVSLFTGVEAIPTAVADWYALLQANPFVGLSLLAVFDLVNYILVGVIFLALGAALWQANKSVVALALTSGLVGATLNLSSNISLTMFSFGQRYAGATFATAKEQSVDRRASRPGW